MHREEHKLLSALRRSEARCSRMNHLISHLVAENQRKDDLISFLQEERKQRQSTEDLECASSLMQLSRSRSVTEGDSQKSSASESDSDTNH